MQKIDILSSKNICVKAPRRQRSLAMTAWDKFATQIYKIYHKIKISLVYDTSKFYFTKCKFNKVQVLLVRL